MKIGNSYYDIACDDFFFLCDAIYPKRFNQTSAQAQQVVEKMLKSVADRVCIGIEKLMLSHNLRALYDAIHEQDPDFKLDRNALSTLKDYYLEARCPGDNFVTVSKDEFLDILKILSEVVTEVERWRKSHDLPCQINAPNRFLSRAYQVLGHDTEIKRMEF